MGNLGRALLRGLVKSFAELAAFLGVDIGNKRKLARFEEDCLHVLPDIRKRFNANEATFSGRARQLPRSNPYEPNSLCWHIWEGMKSGNWIAFGAIKLYVQSKAGRSDHDFKDAIDIVANPWHPKNQGRSILFDTLDNIGFPLYGMAFSIPESTMEVCEKAWGALPRSHPPIVQDTQGGSATITLPKDQPA